MAMFRCDCWKLGKTGPADEITQCSRFGQAIVQPTAHFTWTSALAAAPTGKQADVKPHFCALRMAAELPTPAEDLRLHVRMLQLQLLTKRNDPAPAQTWTADAAKVFANGFDDGAARACENALKVLLKR